MRLSTLILSLLLLLTFPAAPALAGGRCTGSASCAACKNCSGCRHCAKEGGTCGVCSSTTAYAPPPAAPARPDGELLRDAAAPAPKATSRPPERRLRPYPGGRKAYGGDGQALKRAAPAVAMRKVDAGDGGTVAVYFSPGGGCTEAIVGEIEGAKTSVKVQAYRLTSVPIVRALIKAHERGVEVTVVVDSAGASERMYSDATPLFNAGVPVYADREHAIAHNKVILIDGETVITGSFNFSKAAEESNAENLLVIRGKPKLAAAYAKNFAAHLAHAEPYQGMRGGADDDGGDGDDGFGPPPSLRPPARSGGGSRVNPEASEDEKGFGSDRGGPSPSDRAPAPGLIPTGRRLAKATRG